MAQARTSLGRTIAAHAVLITWTLIALFPVFVTVVNSFKSARRSSPTRWPFRGPSTSIWWAIPRC